MVCAVSAGSFAVQRAGENLAGVGFFRARNLFGGPLRDDAAAFFAAFGAKINDPVRLFDDVEIMFDDQDGVAESDEAVEHVEKFFDVVKMQAGGGLVEDVERATGLALGKFTREFGALSFAAGDGGGGLSELHVAEADVHQSLQLHLNRRNIFQNFESFFDGQIEQIGNGKAFVTHGESFSVVALAAANFARNVHIRQEIHFDAALAVALAGFAAPAFHIEAETAGTIAALARLRKHGIELANGRENAGVGGGIGARRAADGRLVNLHDFINVLDAGDGTMRAGLFHRAIEFRSERAVENIVDERGFSGAGDAGDDSHEAEG